MKTCTVCGCAKEKTGFFKRSRAPDGHEAQCKECRKQKNAAWFAANQDRHHEMTRKWYAENTEYHLAKTKERYAADPSKSLSKYYEREERTRRAMPSWADRKAIACIYRKARALTSTTGIKHEVDHSIPLSGKKVSGLHVELNLQVITARENKRKFNNHVI